MSRKVKKALGLFGIGLCAALAPPSAARDEASGAQVFGVYAGTATLAVQDFNVYGQPTGVRTSTQPIRVEVVPIEGAGGESNPFRLVIESHPQTRVPEQGQIVIKSSVLVPLQTGPVLLQFWRLRFDGTNLAGDLADTHAAEGANVANAFFSQVQIAPNLDLGVPVICVLQQGAQLAGVLDGNQVKVRIAGQAACMGGSAHRPFVADVVATRVQGREL